MSSTPSSSRSKNAAPTASANRGSTRVAPSLPPSGRDEGESVCKSSDGSHRSLASPKSRATHGAPGTQ
eukprot:4763848-Pleurochrysis_carterae.AAC.1